jgi:lipopolysaccharide export system protein LptC
MSYIIGLIAIAVFFSALHYFTELNHKQKLGISVVLALIIAMMYAWNVKEAKNQERVNGVILKYNQGHAVSCKGVDVNQTTFDLSTGTQTFIGREGTDHYTEMYSAVDCE